MRTRNEIIELLRHNPALQPRAGPLGVLVLPFCNLWCFCRLDWSSVGAWWVRERGRGAGSTRNQTAIRRKQRFCLCLGGVRVGGVGGAARALSISASVSPLILLCCAVCRCAVCRCAGNVHRNSPGQTRAQPTKKVANRWSIWRAPCQSRTMAHRTIFLWPFGCRSRFRRFRYASQTSQVFDSHT